MAIYPDKKGGRLTGRYCVELQYQQQRYRKRHDTLAEARQAEEDVKAMWRRGESPLSSQRAPGAPEAHTLASVVPLAKKVLWNDAGDAATCWAHVELMAGKIGWGTKMDDIDTLSIDRAIAHLTKLGKANATINRHLSHFRTFLVWSRGRKYRTLPIKDEIIFSWRKESPGRIRWITHEEEEAIRAYLLSRNRPEADAVWDLIKAAIETGCRRDELLTLERAQINGTRLHLWETKTNTPRTVPMKPETAALLVNLIETGTMPSRRSLRSWWDRVRAHLELLDDDDFVFHVTRHTRATRLVDAGINIFVIQDWLGHKRIDTTRRYAHVRPESLEEALAKVGDYEESVRANLQITKDFNVPTQPHTSVGFPPLYAINA